jgi:nucleoside-diphosphate-sugar epimerase
MATYLVTGCAGIIGSHLVEALLDGGDAVDIRAQREWYATVAAEREATEVG